MVDQKQNAARLEGVRDLVEYRTWMNRGPRAVVCHPVQVMVDLDEKNRVQGPFAQAHVIEIDRAMLHARKAVIRESRYPAVVAPVVERRVIDQQYVPMRADEVAHELTVVSPTSQYVRDVHSRLDA